MNATVTMCLVSIVLGVICAWLTLSPSKTSNVILLPSSYSSNPHSQIYVPQVPASISDISFNKSQLTPVEWIDYLNGLFIDGKLDIHSFQEFFTQFIDENILKFPDAVISACRKFPDRRMSNQALGNAIARHFSSIDKPAHFLKSLAPIDLYETASGLATEGHLSLKQLSGLLEYFPKGRDFDVIMQSHLMNVDHDHLLESIEFINTMPDSPLRQTMIVEALLRQSQNSPHVAESSLQLIAGRAAKLQFAASYFQTMRSNGKSSTEIYEWVNNLKSNEDKSLALSAYGQISADSVSIPKQ